MNKFFKRVISLAMAAAITAPVGMGIGVNSRWSGITAEAKWLNVSNTQVTGFSTNSITISWQGDVSADNYEISYQEYASNKDYQVAGRTTNTTYTITGLKSGCMYSIRVTAINSSVPNDYGTDDLLNVKTKVSEMRGVKQDTWYHFIKEADVSWESLSAADGYEYKWKNSAGKVKKKGKVTYPRLSFNVKNNNVYEFMVRAYQKIDGKTYYGKWKTIKVFEQPWAKSVTVKNKRLKISWHKQNGASGYDVYVSKKNKRGSYKKVKSVGKGKTSISLKKFKGKKIKGKYYVYIVSKVKNSKGTSKSGVTYCWNTKSSSYGYVG